MVVGISAFGILTARFAAFLSSDDDESDTEAELLKCLCVDYREPRSRAFGFPRHRRSIRRNESVTTLRLLRSRLSCRRCQSLKGGPFDAVSFLVTVPVKRYGTCI